VLSDGELMSLWAPNKGDRELDLIVRLCLWCGCRRGEAGGMRWSERAGGVWTVPGERTKNHRPLVVPLPRQAVEALADWPRFVGSDQLFGRGPGGYQAWSKGKERLDHRIACMHAEQRLGRKLHPDEEPEAGDHLAAWSLHDLRRTVQTRLIAFGSNRDLVNRILNHAMGPIDEAYDHHTYLPEKLEALQLWADEIERLTSAGGTRVVNLKRRRN